MPRSRRTHSTLQINQRQVRILKLLTLQLVQLTWPGMAVNLEGYYFPTLLTFGNLQSQGHQSMYRATNSNLAPCPLGNAIYSTT